MDRKGRSLVQIWETVLGSRVVNKRLGDVLLALGRAEAIGGRRFFPFVIVLARSSLISEHPIEISLIPLLLLAHRITGIPLQENIFIRSIRASTRLQRRFLQMG